MILLERSLRRVTEWSGIVDVVALPNAVREHVKMRDETVQKKTAAYFQVAVFFVLWSVCGTEENLTNELK